MPDSPDAGSRWDVVVIGAGPAGLFAATRAAERGRRTLLLEKNRKAGVKILMSGGTRCNLTHATDRRGIAEAFGAQGRFLHSPLAALGPDELVARFHAMGVPTKREPTGKVFPVSDRALDVQRACLRMLDASGARLELGRAVRGIDPEAGGFRVATDSGDLWASRVVVTAGGQSYPGCGTVGDAYAWARRLGHRVVQPRPALAPLTSDAPWVRGLQGVTLGDVGLRLVASGGKPQERRRGPVLFTHFGLSGPTVMNASRVVTERPEADAWRMLLDFTPDLNEEALLARLADGAESVGGVVGKLAPRRVADTLLELAAVPGDRRLAELAKRDRRRLVDLLKGAPAPITGSLGFKKAEVTAGGVALDEVDSRDMQSKRVPGLYFAGEVLDLDGPIGGFNFQAAFSTGHLAGDRV